ncbi:MAG: protein phosphatase 2C domain-containing protein [Acidobacteriota bacterium]
MRTIQALTAAAATDPGLQREVNEDRCHSDAGRGVFAVIDGMGGQAAGGKAADVALAMLRARLERETGPTADRVREAIAIANNEIHRLGSLRAEWAGMACVLTVAVVEDGRATIGHVGDTRLYKLRPDRIEKVTRDHSPVGEREDANQLSEAEAMRHPRRNEVYRDVGSEPHQADDPEFVDLQQIPFEPDSALLLCSDGLSDLVPAASIDRIVRQFAGDPRAVVQALVAAANAAGGPDNVTVVYVEGARFAAERPDPDAVTRARPHATTAAASAGTGDRRATTPFDMGPRPRPLLRVTMVALVLVAIGFVMMRAGVLPQGSELPLAGPAPPAAGVEVVNPTQSIADAIQRARPGTRVVVEPGEYREQLRLREDVRVVSRVPRGAILRLPATASELEPAVVAAGVSTAELVGFRIIGDAATPLGVGVLIAGSSVSIVDVEISGATRVAIDFSNGSGGMLVGSDIRDNPGAGLAIRPGASPRIAHSAFVRNGTSEHAPASVIIEPGAAPLFQSNVFHGLTPNAFGTLGEHPLKTMTRDNWFVGLSESRPSSSRSSGPRPAR